MGGSSDTAVDWSNGEVGEYATEKEHGEGVYEGATPASEGEKEDSDGQDEWRKDEEDDPRCQR